MGSFFGNKRENNHVIRENNECTLITEIDQSKEWWLKIQYAMFVKWRNFNFLP